MLKELLRSWQLSRKKTEKKLNGGGGGALLAWPTTAASLQITMEIHISNWTHKFQNRTGLDVKANLEFYKSNRVCSAEEASGTKLCTKSHLPCWANPLAFGLIALDRLNTERVKERKDP